jgi:hypothetical protein
MNLIGRGRMDPRRRHHRHALLALGVLAVCLLAGCTRNKPSPDSLASGALLKDTALYRTMVYEYGPSVFTDTALFRQVCAEADSGRAYRNFCVRGHTHL